MSEQRTTQAHLTITDITDGLNANIWTTSTAPTTPNYTFTISNLTGSTSHFSTKLGSAAKEVFFSNFKTSLKYSS